MYIQDHTISKPRLGLYFDTSPPCFSSQVFSSRPNCNANATKATSRTGVLCFTVRANVSLSSFLSGLTKRMASAAANSNNRQMCDDESSSISIASLHLRRSAHTYDAWLGFVASAMKLNELESEYTQKEAGTPGREPGGCRHCGSRRLSGR